MSDDDVLTEEQEESFLSNSESASGIDFPLASGLNVGRIGQTIIGSIVFAVAYGFNTIIDATATAYAGLVDGVGEFIAGREEVVETRWGIGGRVVEEDGLLDVTLGAGIAAIEGAWSFSLDEFGVFAYVVAVAVFVATVYVADQGFDAMREVLR